MTELVKHHGGCHCGAVEYEVWASPDLIVCDCNCSICTKKQNRHFIVPKSKFTLLKVAQVMPSLSIPFCVDPESINTGEESLTTYTFNTHQAKHMFCKICGVESFYQPRSNPDGYGVMPHCLTPGTVRSFTVDKFDGTNWESAMEQESHKPDSIVNRSKDV